MADQAALLGVGRGRKAGARLGRIGAFAARSPDGLAVGALALVAVLFCGRFLFGDPLLPADTLYTAPPWSAFAAEQGVTRVHNELIADLILQNYSWKRFIAESYQRGQLPLWNPYLFAGQPFLAAGQYAALYPFGLLFLVLPVAAAYAPFAALHLFFAGAFTYLYLRIIGVQRPAAFVGAVTFELAGFLVVSFVWPMILSAAVWLPLGLAMCELVARYLERGQWGAAGLGLAPPARVVVPVGALAVGMQLLAGHLEISFYFLFTLMAYSAVRLTLYLARSRQLVATLRAGFGLLTLVGIGFALAAAQVIPFFELIRENYRIGQVTYAEVVGWALPPQHVLAFAIPDIFGNPTHHHYFNLVTGRLEPVSGSRDAFGNVRDYPFWGVKNYVEGAVYVGLAPLVLAGLALLRRRDRYTAFFGGYLLFCLLLAFGTPLYFLIWQIPGVNQLHTPFRWVYPATFCLAVLAALGAETLLRRRSDMPALLPASATQQDPAAQPLGGGDQLPAETAPGARPDRIAKRLALGCAALGLAIGAAIALSRLALGPTLAAAEALLARSTSLRRAFPTAEMFYSYEAGVVAGFALMLLLVAAAFWIVSRRPTAGVVAIGVVTAVDLTVAFGGFNTASPVRLAEFVPPSIAAIKADPGLFRITSFNYDDTLRPNSNMLFGLPDIRGYDTVILRSYVDYWSLMEPPSGLLYSMINKLTEASSLQSPLLDLLGVKYVLTTQNIGLPGWTEVYRGEINVYRNERALPRAFVVGTVVPVRDAAEARAVITRPDFDPRAVAAVEGPAGLARSGGTGSAELVRYEPTRIEIIARADAPALLLLTDSYFPGWRATLDGREVEIFRANSLFRAIELPPGEHRVVFRYSPLSFQLGAYLSLMGLFAIVLGLAYALWSAVYRAPHDGTTLQRILKNSFAPMATQLANRLVDLAFAVVVARLLGPATVGEYAFAVVLIGYFQIFTDFGLGTLLTREVAQDRTRARDYLANIIGLRLGLVIASLPVVASLVALYWTAFNLTPAGALTIAFFALGLIPGALSASYSAVFYAFEKMEYPAMLTSIATLLRVALGLAALLSGFGIAGLGAVSLIVNVVTALIFWRLLATTFFQPTWRFDWTAARRLWVLSFPLMINNFLSSVFFRIDVLFLKPMQGDAATGYYTTAYKFIDGLNIIPSFFTLAVFPIFSRYAVSSTERLRLGFERSLKLLLSISLPITVLTTLLAGPIILLFFGEEFQPSVIALQILIWFLPFSYVNSITHYVLIALNRQRYLTFAFVIGVTFNIVANILVIPQFSYPGAAAVTVLSEIVLLLPFFYAIRQDLRWLPSPRLLLRPALAAGIAGGAVMLLAASVPWPVLAIVGGAIYLPALALVGGIDREDLALVRRLAGRDRRARVDAAAEPAR
ncbi:MAG: oligosaccharide flippase family protein [Chloroflexota bacterium]|nr:oligosaccharide flippase family protein [Dehalococcoidia bacterium]MDW8253489.1 oligosaccharide flippase family protein [Chloroflexota bacterium]